MVNPLFTMRIRSRWLTFNFVLFCVMEKRIEAEIDQQYSAILISRLDNNLYVLRSRNLW